MSEWWRGAVIYQIYPRSFLDTNGDGVGDLPGVIEKLPYVASLGVDAIWLSPFFKSPMKDFGYDVADYLDVDPEYGTLADFERLLEEARRLGLKVVLDQVYSHSSDQHPWFIESRRSRDDAKADWYVWADPKPDGTPPNNWLSVFGGPAWTWEPRRRQYYFHNFLAEQPDLNFHNPEVQEAVLATAETWLKRGVDGFRLDVANLYCHDPLLRDNPPQQHPSPDKPYFLQRQLYNRDRPETLAFVARMRALLDRYGAMAVAEIGSGAGLEGFASYIDGPERYHTAYGFQLLREGPPEVVIRRTLEQLAATNARAWPSWAFSNHDVARVRTRWGGPTAEAAFAKALIACLVCLRGAVFLYQGEELGLPQGEVPFARLLDPEGIRFWPKHSWRDGARTPMPWRAGEPFGGFSTTEPWLPADPRQVALAVDRQEMDLYSPLAFTRGFLRWRRRQRALIEGDIGFLDSPPGTLAFVRATPEARLLCVFNFGEEPTRVALPGILHKGEAAGHGMGGRIAGDGADLPPYGAAFAWIA